MRIIYLTTVALAATISCYSQQLELVGAAGGDGSTSNAIISYSIGELVVADGNSSSFSQGYQQGNLTVTGIESHNSKFDVSVFPNPTQSRVVIESEILKEFEKITLTDEKGSIIQVISGVSDTRLEIDLSNYASGTYMLNLESRRKNNSKNYKIIKSL